MVVYKGYEHDVVDLFEPLSTGKGYKQKSKKGKELKEKVGGEVKGGHKIKKIRQQKGESFLGL